MKRSGLPMAIGALALSALLQAGPAGAAGVTTEDILNDAVTTQHVVTCGLGPQGQRFSPLS